MEKINKKNSNLICITGFMGCGKSTAIHFFSSLNYEIFEMDKFIHSIYKKNEEGYLLIKKLFGNEYINDNEVDRKKLKKLILSNPLEKEKLDLSIGKIMKNKIKELFLLNRLIFVEFGVYLYKQENYFDFFKSIILVNSTRKNIIDDFKKIHNDKLLPTKYVGNSKNFDFKRFLYIDFIVENNENIEKFQEKLSKILKKL